MNKFKKIAYNRNEGPNWQMFGQDALLYGGTGAFAGPWGAVIGVGSAAAEHLGGNLIYQLKGNKKKLSQLAADIERQLTNLSKALPPELKEKYNEYLLYWIQTYKK